MGLIARPVPVPSPENRSSYRGLGETFVSGVVLPPVWDFVNDSYQKAFSNWNLILLLLLMQILNILAIGYFVFQFFAEMLGGGGAGVLLFFPVFIFLGLLSMVVTLTVLRFIAKERELESIGGAFKWSLRNFLPFLWVMILMACVVYGGTILLVIPGIIVMVLLIPAVYVFVCEGIRGLDVLMRSRQLVLGYWWPVAGRLFALLISVYVILFALMFMIELSIDPLTTSTSPTLSLILPMVLPQLIMTAVFLVFYFGIHQIYVALAKARPLSTFDPKESRGRYKVLAGLGLFFPVIAILSSVVLASLNSARNEAKEASFLHNLNSVRPVAEIYYNNNGFSYDGVCGEIKPLVQSRNSECIDADDSWAMTATPNDRPMAERYCVDDLSSPQKGYLDYDRAKCSAGSRPVNYENDYDDNEGLMDAKSRATDLRSNQKENDANERVPKQDLIDSESFFDN